MARTYKRDSRGRFAGGGGGNSSRGPVKVGRSGPRGGKTGTRAEQRQAAKAQMARSAQFRGKAAEGRDARAAYKAAAGAARKTGRSGAGQASPAAGAASGIRRTGGLPRPVAASGIRPTTGPRRAPLARKQNAVRSYEPKTAQGKMEQAKRKLNRRVDDVLKKAKDFTSSTSGLNSRADRIMRRMARSTARTIVESQQKGVIGDIARSVMKGEGGTMQRAGREVIRRRASRAAAAAARGSKPAAKAMGIYDRQLAPALPGKPGKKAKNNLRPGPRNTNPPKPKRSRKPRKPKG